MKNSESRNNNGESNDCKSAILQKAKTYLLPESPDVVEK